MLAAFLLWGPAAAVEFGPDLAGAPVVSRLQFQTVVAGQLRQYMALPPAAGLARLETLAALPSAQFPALATDRAAAQAALTLIVSPNAASLQEDRETRVLMSRALGRQNVASILTASEGLSNLAAVDPALNSSIQRIRAKFSPQEAGQTDIAQVQANLKEFFDRASVPGFASLSMGGVDARSILIPVHPSGLSKPGPQAASGLTARAVPEGDGFVTTELGSDGRTRRFKVYPKDGISFERREIPGPLSDYYEELPEGALRRRRTDPLVAALDAAKIDLWTLRHGETTTNRAGTLGGGGTDSALTKTPNEQGTSGEGQARAAALKMYEELGGDSWARAVLLGVKKPVVILVSPLTRSRQTAAAFTDLLDYKRQRLATGRSGRLYELHIERGLKEIAFGELEGWTIEKGSTLSAWPALDGMKGLGRTFLDRFPGGESRFDVMMRQRGVLRRVIKDYPGRQVITFAHSETVVAQKAVLGLVDVDPKDQALKSSAIPNAEPIRLSFGAAGSMARSGHDPVLLANARRSTGEAVERFLAMRAEAPKIRAVLANKDTKTITEYTGVPRRTEELQTGDRVFRQWVRKGEDLAAILRLRAIKAGPTSYADFTGSKHAYIKDVYVDLQGVFFTDPRHSAGESRVLNEDMTHYVDFRIPSGVRGLTLDGDDVMLVPAKPGTEIPIEIVGSSSAQ